MLAAADYAGVIQAFAAGQIEIAYMSPAAYAAAWMESNGNVRPLLTTQETDGSTSYVAVMYVRADSGIADLAGMKGKRIGVTIGSASDVFWQALLTKFKFNPKDYKVVNVEPPEMLAALERHDVDVVSSWEPWTSRILSGVPGAKVLTLNEGIFVIRDYVYLNKGWAEKNPAALKAFMLSMVEATKLLTEKPEEAADYVAKTLKLEPSFTAHLMTRVDFEIRLNKDAIDHIKTIEKQLADSGKLQKPIVWKNLFWSEPLASVAPENVEPLFE
jgi:ABC-type nitrate/sulfonate/bicarbonate transport system substrate-binding protein